MKKFFYSLFLFALPIAMFISCEEPVGGEIDDPTQEPDSLPTLPVETPEEQKKALEQTALAFVDEVAAANFEEVAELATYLAERYSEDNYDYESLEDWSEDCYDALVRTFEKTEISEGRYEHWDGSYITSVYIEDYYSVICAASNYTGKFEAKNGFWKYSEADDLSFHVKDDQGRPCVLRLTTSGNTKKVYVGNDYNYISGSYDYENYVDSTYYSVDEFYLMVPEVITVTLQQDGDYIAKAVLKADLSSMKGEEFDLRKDKYNVTATLEFNGYAFAVENFLYAPEKGSSVAMSFKKGNKSLFSVKASADIDVANEEFYGSENNKVEIDVMGRVQIKGNMSGDIVEAYEELEEIYDADNESMLRKQLNKVNSLMDLNLYYDNLSTPSAKFELRAFESESNNGEWNIEPVIVFADETSYGIEEYFNEDNFKKVIRAIERLGEDYEDLLEDFEEIYG